MKRSGRKLTVLTESNTPTVSEEVFEVSNETFDISVDTPIEVETNTVEVSSETVESESSNTVDTSNTEVVVTEAPKRRGRRKKSDTNVSPESEASNEGEV